MARGLAQVGAQVGILGRRQAQADKVVIEIEQAGGVAMALPADVLKREQLEAAREAVLERWGRIDILAANAGIYPAVPIDEITHDLFRRVMDVNVAGAVHAVQACLPAMRAQGYGRVVLTSSITGPLVGQPGYSVYGSSKAAMLGWMRGAALELVRDGITINAVQPGNVRTGGFEELAPAYQQEMIDAIPMRRLAEPEEVGWAVRFLASEEAGYITGQTLILDGGQVLPEGQP
jgi:3-oxoacyl-[acyl-carrier protein] reductase